jgi:hypothetical protein
MAGRIMLPPPSLPILLVAREQSGFHAALKRRDRM